MTSGAAQDENIARLLIQLSRVSFSAKQREEIAGLLSGLTEWPRFTALLIRHGVGALVWQNIVDMGFVSLVPEEEQRVLEQVRLQTISRVTFICEAAREISSMLESSGVRTLLIKGTALDGMVYGSRALRQMSDADILVSPEDALKAADILSSAGYLRRSLKSPLYRKIVLDLGNHLPQMHRNGISVDIHHRLFGPNGMELTSQAMENACYIEIAGERVRVLPPDTAFLGLVTHLFKHSVKGEFQLRLFTDIYLLIEKYREEIVNGDLGVKARAAGCVSEMETVMTVIDDAYGADIPAGYLVSSEHRAETTGAFRDYLLNPQLTKALPAKTVYRRTLESIPGFYRKMLFVTGDIFPSVGFMKERYGRRKTLAAIFYYPHRIGKLLWLAEYLISKKK